MVGRAADPVRACSKEYEPVTVKSTADDLTLAPATVNRPLGLAVAAALKRLQHSLGGKNLAGFFDGRDGEEVAESTISRWIHEPRRFPAVFLPALVELDHEFRGEVLRHLTASLATDAAVVARMSPKAADEYRRALEGVLVEQVAPGRWGR